MVEQEYRNTNDKNKRIALIKQYLSGKPDEELFLIMKQKNNPEFLNFQIIQELKKRQNEREKRYSKIRTEATDIIQGHKRISRLPEQAERGRIEGGERTIQASIIVGKNGSRLQALPIRELKEQQEQKLEEWAKHEKIWLDHEDIRKNWKRLDDGTSMEAEVYNFPETRTVRKVFHYDKMNFNDTPLNFIDNRIAIHNTLFPATKYTMLGVTKTYKGLAFVLEQPFIEDGVTMTKQETADYMKSKGFPNHDDTYHWNDYYIVGDLHKNNIMKVVDGNVIVFIIDPDARLNTSDPEDENGKTKYLPFKVIKSFP